MQKIRAAHPVFWVKEWSNRKRRKRALQPKPKEVSLADLSARSKPAEKSDAP